MALFPLFVELKDQPCLVVGAGTVALRRIEALLDFGARLTVCAPQVAFEIEALATDQRLTLHRRAVLSTDIEGMALVVTATDHSLVNQQVRQWAQEQGVVVNSADAPPSQIGEFAFPALVRRGELVMGISTSGQVPGLSRAVRQQCDQWLNPHWETWLEELALLRAQGSPVWKTRLAELLKQEGWTV